MPRKPRFNLIGIPQHIVQRGNNREPCFLSVEDYHRYLQDLSEAAMQYRCRIHAYVLMTNHVHLLVTPMITNGLSSMMQALGRRYVRYFNNAYKRTGTLWEGRYKASLVDSDKYLLTCMRYIELNPVRARMVEHPGDYRWSSYHVNAQSRKDKLIHSHPVYTQLGDSDEERKSCYRELFRDHIGSYTVDQIREALNQELVLGRPYFKEKIREMTKRQTMPGKPGRPRVEEDSITYFMFG